MVLAGGSIMRLWNTLHQLYRDKLACLRSVRNKRIRRAERPRTRLEVEALDQRLLPSSVPNLGGLTMHFGPGIGPVYTPPNTLAITSVQDQGGGKGTFVAVFDDFRDGVVTAVSGAITLKSIGPGWSDPLYDFGVTFSGSATHFQFNPRTGLWSETVDRASGSGDFYTNAVSGDASIYQQNHPGQTPPGSWIYSGNESDSYSYSSSSGGYTLSESGPVWSTNWAILG
jgi:hypothetical protein